MRTSGSRTTPLRPAVARVSWARTSAASRRAARGVARDLHRPDGPVPAAAAVPVVTVDARLSTQDQLAQILQDLGRGAGAP